MAERINVTDPSKGIFGEIRVGAFTPGDPQRAKEARRRFRTPKLRTSGASHLPQRDSQRTEGAIVQQPSVMEAGSVVSLRTPEPPAA